MLSQAKETLYLVALGIVKSLVGKEGIKVAAFLPKSFRMTKE